MRLFSTMNQKSFLHIEDAFGIDRIRFFIGNYQRGSGASSQGYANMHFDMALVVMHDILYYGKLPESLYEKQSAEAMGGGGDPLVSRYFAIRYQESRNNPFTITVRTAKGQRTRTNGIMPVKDSVISDSYIVLSRFEARKMAARVLSEINGFLANTQPFRIQEAKESAQSAAEMDDTASTPIVPESPREEPPREPAEETATQPEVDQLNRALMGAFTNPLNRTGHVRAALLKLGKDDLNALTKGEVGTWVNHLLGMNKSEIN